MTDRWQALQAEWFEASEHGRLADVRRLLKDGVHIEARDAHGRTALMLAAKGRQLGVVHALLAHRARTDARDSMGWTAQTYAVNRPSPHFSAENPWKSTVGPSREIFDILRDAGGKFGLREAVLLGDVRLIRSLCHDGADPSGNARWYYHDTHLMVATDVGEIDSVRALLELGADIEGEDDLGDRAMMRAATAGRVDLATLLLDRGADLDKPNWAWVTPLSMAALEGQPGVVELFLRRGARRDLLDAIACDDIPLLRSILENPSVRNGIPDYPDRSHHAPFGRPAMYAARRGNAEAVDLLLRHGAEPDAAGHENESPMAVAAFHGHAAVVRVLLSAGARVDAVGRGNLTALDWAIRGGHEEVIRLLQPPSG
ncbi:ankyrin repeat domain-containing protein [Singulisphaera sp. PoT]|uniref:ankyrin repeat domain-containing protein n=1 Tax=Singulisphaera sp. PoT TaxID=3411797 RepID=UPI003BF5F9D2